MGRLIITHSSLCTFNDAPRFIRKVTGRCNGRCTPPGLRQNMPKRARDEGEEGGGELAGVAICHHPTFRRYAALVLRDVAGFSVAEVGKLVNGADKKSLQRWRAWFDAGESCEAPPRKKRGGVVRPQHIQLAKKRLREGGQGQQKHQSLRQAHPGLAEAGVPGARETLRVALHAAEHRPRPVRSKGREVANAPVRVGFARLEGRRIGLNTAFSDSKIFIGSATRSTCLGQAWADPGDPVTVAVVQGGEFRVHAYAAITRHGPTPLIFTAGTAPPRRARRGRPTNAERAAAAAAAAANPVAAAASGRNAVDHRVYQDSILPAMLRDSKSIFAAAGKQVWRWQHDGAGAHTTADTPKGRPARQMIAQAPAQLVCWPANSPDMSPIEKAWSVVTAHVWRKERWQSQQEFEAALRRSWAAAITPDYCRRLFGGIPNTYRAVEKGKGARVRGWGKKVKEGKL